MALDDTIAAIVTPLGRGGVGVVRISGDQAVKISSDIIKDFPQNIKPRYLYHRWIEGLDEITFVYMKAPRSYTGEEVVEINTHGGLAVMQEVLRRCLALGARHAGPGEYTKRALLNGKLDLAQAEAVLEIINARTSLAAEIASGQLGGRLTRSIDMLRAEMINLLTRIEAEMDFEEDVERINTAELLVAIEKLSEVVNELIRGAKGGRVLKEGLSVAIAGKPNVGKSSLLNRLAGQERAIVTEMAGTTRDAIEEVIEIEGIPIRMIDTAGIRIPRDAAEREGVKRAEEIVKGADIVVALFDASKDGEDSEDRMVESLLAGRQVVLALNKIDLGMKTKRAGEMISALTGEGIEKLKKAIVRDAKEGANGHPILATERQIGCLLKANEALQNTIKSIRIKQSLDVIAIDLREAIEALGQITGASISDEVIEGIFRQFCVGK